MYSMNSLGSEVDAFLRWNIRPSHSCGRPATRNSSDFSLEFHSTDRILVMN